MADRFTSLLLLVRGFGRGVEGDSDSWHSGKSNSTQRSLLTGFICDHMA